jgi:hypothetical protein
VSAIQRITKSKKLPLIILHRNRVNNGPAKAPYNQKILESWRNAGALYSTPPGSNDDWSAPFLFIRTTVNHLKLKKNAKLYLPLANQGKLLRV